MATLNIKTKALDPKKMLKRKDSGTGTPINHQRVKNKAAAPIVADKIMIRIVSFMTNKRT